jgi:hypothetical protein
MTNIVDRDRMGISKKRVATERADGDRITSPLERFEKDNVDLLFMHDLQLRCVVTVVLEPMKVITKI